MGRTSPHTQVVPYDPTVEGDSYRAEIERVVEDARANGREPMIFVRPTTTSELDEWAALSGLRILTDDPSQVPSTVDPARIVAVDLPPPPPSLWSRRRSRANWIVAVVGIAVLLPLVVMAPRPSPYQVRRPDEIFPITELVDTTGKTGPAIKFATLTEPEARWGEMPYLWIAQHFSPGMQLRRMDQPTSMQGCSWVPQGLLSTDQESAETRSNARLAAILESGGKVGQVSGSGIRVTSSSHAPGGPPIGSTIVKAGGVPVATTFELDKVLAKHVAGDRVPVTMSDGSTAKLWMRPAPFASRGYLTCEVLDTVDLRYTTDVDLPFKKTKVIGSSSGLAVALWLEGFLSGDDVVGQHKIVATGNIDGTGKVRRVGGVAQKAYAASGIGAELFLVPEGLGGEAARFGPYPDMVVVEVGDLHEAVEVLRRYTAQPK